MPKDNKDNKKGQEDGKGNMLKDVGKFALQTAAISGSVLGGATLGLNVIGFTESGVLLNSLAAKYQSAHLGGTILKESLFSHLQRAGVIGLSTTIQTAVVMATAVGIGLFTLYSSRTSVTDPVVTSGESNESDEDVDEVVMEENGDSNVWGKINKNINSKKSEASTKKSESMRKDKKFPVKLAGSFTDSTSNSLEFSTQPPKHDYEMDILWKKMVDIQLNKDIAITQHLIKK